MYGVFGVNKRSIGIRMVIGGALALLCLLICLMVSIEFYMIDDIYLNFKISSLCIFIGVNASIIYIVGLFLID